MPKDYDFSVRNVNWGDYKDDFILRTDAIWEKTMLKDYFYSLYKQHNYRDGKYFTQDWKVVRFQQTHQDQSEDWVPWMGYSDIDGMTWQYQTGPKLFAPQPFSHYVADKEGDAWLLCYTNF